MKKYLLASCILLSLFAFRNNDRKKNRAVEIKMAISKSLSLLESSSHTFLINAPVVTTCHSCHNNGLSLVTFSIAKENGFPVSDTIINEAVDSTMNWWKSEVYQQALPENDDPIATVMVGNYDLWGLSAIGYKSNKYVEGVSRNIMRKQTYDGSWVSPGQRPPLEYYSISATALAIRNMQIYMPPILHNEVEQRIETARSWLLKNKPDANEEKVFQLLGLIWSHGDKTVIEQLAKKLLAAQHNDGGWSQLDSLPTDAYATGQSLYALYQAGLLTVTTPSYQKGVDFLLSSQFPDGSWKVITRSYPFQSYVNSGFPHEKDQFISAAGSNWATMALIPAAK